MSEASGMGARQRVLGSAECCLGSAEERKNVGTAGLGRVRAFEGGRLHRCGD